MLYFWVLIWLKMFSALRIESGWQTGLYEKHWPKRITPSADKYSSLSDWNRSVQGGILLAA